MQEDLLGSMKEGMLAQRQRLKDALIKQFKMQVPKQDIPAIYQIYAKDNLGWEDFNNLRQKYGDKEIERVFGAIEKLRADGRRA